MSLYVMYSYVGATGRMMAGREFEEIVLEAGICASFTDDYELLPPELNYLACDPNHISLLTVSKDESLLRFASEFENYCRSIRKGNKGKTSQFWMAYMDSGWRQLSSINKAERL